ncbi:MAG TPA: amidohydrolase family protein [Candidatus Xenobia bacterium]|nr:amidohydrolase family protein [Candidatus Xenobia bacterium]
MKRATFLASVALLAGALAAPAHAQKAVVYALTGAKIYTLAGPPIENGTVIIRDGKIAAVGTGIEVPAGAEVIDAKGLQVYPGLFDSYSRLGLTEIGQVSATVDLNELNQYNPHLNAYSAIHPASEHIPVARANGITHAVSAPGGGGFGGGGGAVIPGQATLINLSGWTVEEMDIRKSVGLVLNWPSMQTTTFDLSTFETRQRPFAEVKKEYEERVGKLEEWLDAARQYAQAMVSPAASTIERDQKLEALVPVVKGELPVIVNANQERDIRNALEFCQKQKLRMILAGGGEAWKVKDELKKAGVPVILRPVQTLPMQEDDPYDRPNTTPGELNQAGVKIAIATFDSSDSRTLPYEAGNAVPFGLPWEEAIKAITLYPAQILGVGDQLGSIEVGKRANLIVTDGDPLEFKTQVRYLFIGGQPTSMENRHHQLYEKYRARPK